MMLKFFFRILWFFLMKGMLLVGVMKMSFGFWYELGVGKEDFGRSENR